MTGTIDVVYPYTQCDKTYNIRSSFQSHMRQKHKANTKTSDNEKVKQDTQKKSNTGQSFWVVFERERPLMSTNDLNFILANMSDASLVNAALEAEQFVEAESIGKSSMSGIMSWSGTKKIMI